MGDELGLPDDPHWAGDPAHADDNRWMHRPWMDWDAAQRRSDPAAVEGRLWAGLRRLVEARRATKAVHADGRGEAVWSGNDHVLALDRRHAGRRLLFLANVTAGEQAVHLAVADDRGLAVDEVAAAVPDGRPLRRTG